MNRSCKFCMWKVEMDNLLGKIQWCGVKGEEITLGGYCPNFKQKIFKELD